MLLRFNVKNFMSFDVAEDQRAIELCMIADDEEREETNDENHVVYDGTLGLLKFTALYGANASGKSNLVKAIEFMRKSIVEKLPIGYSEKYCKTNMSNREKPSYFEVEFEIQGAYYAYGFEICLHTGCFLEEWFMRLYPNKETQESSSLTVQSSEINSYESQECIFYRNIVEQTYELGTLFQKNSIKQRLCIYLEDMKADHNNLFLSFMNQSNKSIYEEEKEVLLLKEVYTWMKDSIIVTYPNQPLFHFSYVIRQGGMQEIYQLLYAFGTGITGIQAQEISFDKLVKQLPKQVVSEIIKKIDVTRGYTETILQKSDEIRPIDNSPIGLLIRNEQEFFILEIPKDDNRITCKTITFSHQVGEPFVYFHLNEESDGTIRILDLLDILLNKEENKTYIIDELDRCLHPSLTIKFIETFIQQAKKRKIQLIVTTHEPRLMDANLLRRDEIWFVDKNTDGQSQVYSLDEYQNHFDTQLQEAYLEGRYGGIPTFHGLSRKG